MLRDRDALFVFLSTNSKVSCNDRRCSVVEARPVDCEKWAASRDQPAEGACQQGARLDALNRPLEPTKWGLLQWLRNVTRLHDSQALGYGIVAGASLLKVPQILSVLNSGSAAGLNLASFELENIGYSIHTAYGFVLGLPFSAFGEAVIILLQNTLLLSIIYYYARAPLWRGFLMIVLTAFGGYFVLSGSVAKPFVRPVNCPVSACLLPTGNATEKMVMSAYELNNFIFILARVPQIWSNFKVTSSWCPCGKVPSTKGFCSLAHFRWHAPETVLELVLQAKNTGQLSLITSGMSAAGAVARIFTSIQEGAGLSMVRGFCIGESCLGSTISRISACPFNHL